jgi:hypothetical protein
MRPKDEVTNHLSHYSNQATSTTPEVCGFDSQFAFFGYYMFFILLVGKIGFLFRACVYGYIRYNKILFHR